MKKHWLGLALAVVLMLTAFPVFAAETPETPPVMVSSQALVDKMKEREGFSGTPYWDYSHYSIGYGTTCPDNKVDYYKKNPMSREEAEVEFKKFLSSYEAAVRNFATKYSLTLTQNKFDALVSFSYNCGSGWMSSTSGYFNTAVRTGLADADLLYGMTLYSTAGGQYILIGRRLWEANIYINGDYGTGPKGSYPDSFRYVYLDGNGGTVRYKICAFDTKMGFKPPVAFSDIPTGVDKEGKPFVYTFGGWYTDEGKKVETLDEQYERGQTLYAKWLDPEGKEMDSQKQTFPVGATAVNMDETCNLRKGPGTNYSKVGTLAKGAKVTVYEEKLGTTAYGTNVWCRIGEDKWVISYFVEYDKPEDQKPASTKLAEVTATGVYIRKGPGTSFATNGTLTKGNRIDVWEEVEGETAAGTNIWCKIGEEQYINKSFITYIEEKVTGIKILKMPDETTVYQPVVEPDYEGSVLQVTYASGKIKALTMTRSMVSGFSRTTLGKQTVKVSYGGKTLSFNVTLEAAKPAKPTVPEAITSEVYKIEDGNLTGIAPGTTVKQLLQNIPQRDFIKVYQANAEVTGDTPVGTDMTVTLHDGDKAKSTLNIVIRGDVTGDGAIDGMDATALLQYSAGWEVPLNSLAADVNGDDSADGMDATLLLQYAAGWEITITQ